LKNYYKFFIVICSSFFLFSCSKEIATVLDAEVTTTDIKQTHYEILNSHGLVEVYYNIKNVGNVEIDYYKVSFKVTCEDGSTYTEWDNGTNVGVGKELSDHTYLNVADKKYSKVEVVDIELDTY